MSPFQRWGLVCVWSLLAASPAGAADPAVPAPAGVHSESGAAPPVKPIPDCPHCRKLGLLGPAPAAGAGPAPAAGRGEMPAIALPHLEEIKGPPTTPPPPPPRAALSARDER